MTTETQACTLTQAQQQGTPEPTKDPMIGIVCERSVDLTDKLDANGCLKSMPNVKIVKVPCSGMIQPIMLETALKNGAVGVFACGCRMGDCHYREGNKFLRERLLGTRPPKLKQATDKSKIEAYWLSVVEYPSFESMIHEFRVKLAQAKA